MPGELHQIYANKTAINAKRTALTGIGSGFETVGYWSSRESSSNFEYRVHLYSGTIDYFSKDSHDYMVLGFLALEY